MKIPDRNTNLLIVIASILICAIFISDLFTPLGIADGINYIAIVLLTIWMKEKYHTFIAVFTCIALTVLGYYLSPPAEQFYIVFYNRFFSIAGIIIAGVIIMKYKSKEETIMKQKEVLEKLTEELKISNSDLEQFAYVASHDLQEPLRKIQSFGERIQVAEKDRLSDNGKDYFARMMNASSRMQVLINDILSYSRLSTRKDAFIKIDLNELVKDVLNDMETSIEKNRVKIDLKPLPVIDGDMTQMRQLFQNLISNAIKFKREEEIPEIKIFSRELNSIHSLKKVFAEIIVQDNGIGFDEKYSDKIFQFFQRLEGKKYEGTGIGLAVCRKIVLRHGGNISVESQPGAGSKFIIMLPIQQINSTS